MDNINKKRKLRFLKHLPSEINERTGNLSYYSLFHCGYCGETVKRVNGSHKKQNSCGCKNDGYYKHGGKNTRLYRIWRCMIQRCEDKNIGPYKNYGGRGITVCNEWRESFVEFRKWCEENGYNETLEIDRKNNDDGYYPGNCRFVTKFGNARNKRSNKLNWVIVDAIRDLHKNRILSAVKLGKIFGITPSMVHRVLRKESWGNNKQ